MKRALLVVSILTVIGSFTACTPKTVESTEASTTVETSKEDETTKADEETTVAEGKSTEATDSARLSYEEMKTLFIPKSATVVATVDGGFQLTSTDEYSELVAFYESALETFGAKEVAKVDNGAILSEPDEGDMQRDLYSYLGTYGDNDTNIAISIIKSDTDGVLDISIAY